MTAVFPPPRFDLWCAVLDARLRDYTGLGLNELPTLPLRTWWASGHWPAQTVADVLAKHIGTGIRAQCAP